MKWEDEYLPLMAWFSDHELQEDLWWRVRDDGTLVFHIDCNDMFWWATSDAEEVTIADIPELQRAYDDLNKLPNHMSIYAPELWIARKRGMRPQRPWLQRLQRSEPAVMELFLDAGPERDPKEEG